MDSSQVNLTIDIQNNRLVSVAGTPTALNGFFQDNTKSLRIQCVNPSQTSSSPQVTAQSFTTLDMSGFGMRVAVGDTPAGITGPTPLALVTLTYDNVSQSFIGQLPLNTTGIDTFLGAAAAKTAYFEVNLTINGTRITVLQATFTLFAVVDELTGTVPTPTDKYLTALETVAQFVPRKGAAGQTFVLVSPDGTKSLEIGVDNNGQLFSNELS